MACRPHLFVAVFLCILISSSAEWEVLQTQILTRHGARTRLYKNTFTNAEGYSAALTPAGEVQCYTAGTQLRARYMDNTSDAYIPGLEPISLTEVMFNSSDTDRTLASALSLAYGLYPTTLAAATTDTGTNADVTAALSVSLLPGKPTIVPVHTNAAANDIVIRAYDKCESYDQNLANLYSSSAFGQYAATQAGLLAALQAALASADFCTEEAADPKFEDFFNLYDCLNIRRENVGDVVPQLISNETWNQVLAAANWLEQQKFAPAQAGTLLGGNYLGRVSASFAAAVAADTSGSTGIRLQLNSAHYPTIKGVLAALDMSDQVYGIPGYSSYLIIELLKDASAGAAAYGVRMLFQDSYAGVLTPMTLPAVSGFDAADTTGALTWDAFLALLDEKDAAYNDPADWCVDCANETADVCLQAQVTSLLSSAGADDGDAKVSPALYIALAGFAGIVLGAFLGFVGGRHRKRGEWVGGEYDVGGVGGGIGAPATTVL